MPDYLGKAEYECRREAVDLKLEPLALLDAFRTYVKQPFLR